MNDVCQEKFIVTSPNYVLCNRGFVRKDKFDKQTIHFFSTPEQVRRYMRNCYPKNIKYKIQKVKLKMEVMEYETEV